MTKDFISDEEFEKLKSKELSSSSSPDFISDDEFNKINEKSPVSGSTKAQAALQGFGEAATFGYLPQIQAAVSPYLEKGYELLTGKDITDESYIQRRDEAIKRSQMLAEQAPGYYAGGQIAGSLAVPIPGVTALKGGSALARTGKAALSGAATGALYNPGDVEGELSGAQLSERAKQGLIGGVVGGAVQGAGQAIKKTGELYANKGQGLSEKGSNLLLKTLGAKTPEVRKLIKKNRIDKVGKFASDEGLISFGDTADTAYNKISSYVDDTGKQIGETYKQLRATLNDPDFIKNLSDKEKDQLLKTELNPVQLSFDVMDKVKEKFKGKAGSPAAIKKVAQELEVLAGLGKQAEIEDVLKFRRSIDDLVNFDQSVKDAPITQQALRETRELLNDKLFSRIDEIDKLIKSKPHVAHLWGFSNRIKELNKRFSLASDLESIATTSRMREKSKMPIGPLELMVGSATGAGAYASGDENDLMASAAKGLLAAGALKGIRTYGPGLAGPSMMKAGSVLQKDPLKNVGNLGARIIEPALSRPGLIGSVSERTRRKPELKKSK